MRRWVQMILVCLAAFVACVAFGWQMLQLEARMRQAQSGEAALPSTAGREPEGSADPGR